MIRMGQEIKVQTEIQFVPFEFVERTGPTYGGQGRITRCGVGRRRVGRTRCGQNDGEGSSDVSARVQVSGYGGF
jgi:hypothetical protein